jgi:hypothetical protein
MGPRGITGSINILDNTMQAGDSGVGRGCIVRSTECGTESAESQLTCHILSLTGMFRFKPTSQLVELLHSVVSCASSMDDFISKDFCKSGK